MLSQQTRTWGIPGKGYSTCKERRAWETITIRRHDSAWLKIFCKRSKWPYMILQRWACDISKAFTVWIVTRFHGRGSSKRVVWLIQVSERWLFRVMGRLQGQNLKMAILRKSLLQMSRREITDERAVVMGWESQVTWRNIRLDVSGWGRRRTEETSRL